MQTLKRAHPMRRERCATKLEARRALQPSCLEQHNEDEHSSAVLINQTTPLKRLSLRCLIAESDATTSERCA
jgi:hypothetical protein